MSLVKSGILKLKEMSLCAIALGDTARQKWGIFWRQTKNVRVRLGLARYHPDRIYELPTRYAKIFLRDNFGDVTNLPDLLHRNVYRLGRLAEKGVVLDIGANIGLFAAWAAWHNPGTPIYCFEPLASNARLIPLNCPTAIVRQVGVGGERCRIKLGVDFHGIMASSISTPWPTHDEEFEMLPLDELLREYAIEQVAFMKIDTEGMELEALDGGQETLRRTHRVALETHGIERHRECIKRLCARGFILDAEEFSESTGLVFASRASFGTATVA